MPLAGAATLLGFATALLTLEIAPGQPEPASLPDQAAALAARLERETAAAVALAGTVRARLSAGDVINWKDFEALVANAPTRSPVQKLVAWAPRVPATTREAFEAESGRDGFRSFRIGVPGRNPAGRQPLTQVPPNQAHHPIALTAPLSPGSDLLGLDLTALPGFASAVATLGRDEVTLIGPTTLLPAPACATDPSRLPCAPALFVIVGAANAPADGEGTAHDARAGFVVVALSWPEIAVSARGPTPRLYTAFSESPTARATFRVHEQPWSLELRRPVGHGRATASLDVLFDRVAQSARGN
ncbi:MAG TPA: CHASE domain-containing protein [Polyangia bacterium]